MNDQYGVKPSGGSVQNWTIQAANNLAADYVVNQQAIIQAKSAHFDESGLRRDGKTEWLHPTFRTPILKFWHFITN